MDFRLVLEDRELPAQFFFNSIPDSRFVATLQALAGSVGAGFDDAVCEFPEDGDEFNGVRFALPGEEIVVSRARFAELVRASCAAYLIEHSAEAKSIAGILEMLGRDFGQPEIGD